MYQPHQPFNAAPGGSAIAVTARYWWVAFVFGLLKPFLAVDGQRCFAGWGRTVVPVQPGQHHVHMHVPYFLPSQVGPADTVVTVHPGQVVELEYRAPAIGWLAGAIGPAPQPVRGMAAGIAILVVPLVMALCVCGVVGVALVSSDRDRDPIALPTAVEPAPTRPRPTTLAPEPTGTTEPSGKPTLRPVPARALVGPVFGAGDDTYTMDFTGWPFAFRTPRTWGCIGGKVDLPDAKAWVCIDEKNPRSGQRLQIMLRPCALPCGIGERNRLNTDWFDPGVRARQHSLRTWYVETPRDDKGRYALDVSHYFPLTEPAWQVGIGVFSPPGTKADVQKIVNDVLSQTSG